MVKYKRASLCEAPRNSIVQCGSCVQRYRIELQEYQRISTTELRKIRVKSPYLNVTTDELTRQLALLSHQIVIKGNMVYPAEKRSQSLANSNSEHRPSQSKPACSAIKSQESNKYMPAGSEGGIEDESFCFVPAGYIPDVRRNCNTNYKKPISNFIEESVARSQVSEDSRISNQNVQPQQNNSSGSAANFQMNDIWQHTCTIKNDEIHMQEKSNKSIYQAALGMNSPQERVYNNLLPVEEPKQNEPNYQIVEDNKENDENRYKTDFESLQDLINTRTKFRLEMLIQKFPDGIWCSELPERYRIEYKIPLDYVDLGFSSVSDFAAHLPQIFHIVQPIEGGDFILYNAKIPLPESDTKKRPSQKLNLASYYYLDRDDVDPFPTQISPDISAQLIPADVLTYGECVGQVSVTELGGQKGYEAVLVEEIFTPSFFWIRLLRKSSKLTTLMKDLNEFYYAKAPQYLIPPVVITRGLHCACKYHNEWHRSIVKQVKLDGRVSVEFYDYGTLKTCLPEELHFLHRTFSWLPAQAIPCGLYNVKPRSGSHWTRGVTQLFAERVDSGPLVASLTSIDTENNSMLVVLVDTSKEEDVHINDWMVQQNLAIYGSMVRIRPRNLPYRQYLECQKLISTKSTPDTSNMSENDLLGNKKSNAFTAKKQPGKTSLELLEEFSKSKPSRGTLNYSDTNNTNASTQDVLPFHEKKVRFKYEMSSNRIDSQNYTSSHSSSNESPNDHDSLLLLNPAQDLHNKYNDEENDFGHFRSMYGGHGRMEFIDWIKLRSCVNNKTESSPLHSSLEKLQEKVVSGTKRDCIKQLIPINQSILNIYNNQLKDETLWTCDSNIDKHTCNVTSLTRLRKRAFEAEKFQCSKLRIPSDVMTLLRHKPNDNISESSFDRRDKSVCDIDVQHTTNNIVSKKETTGISEVTTVIQSTIETVDNFDKENNDRKEIECQQGKSKVHRTRKNRYAQLIAFAQSTAQKKLLLQESSDDCSERVESLKDLRSIKKRKSLQNVENFSKIVETHKDNKEILKSQTKKLNDSHLVSMKNENCMTENGKDNDVVSHSESKIENSVSEEKLVINNKSKDSLRDSFLKVMEGSNKVHGSDIDSDDFSTCHDDLDRNMLKRQFYNKTYNQESSRGPIKEIIDKNILTEKNDSFNDLKKNIKTASVNVNVEQTIDFFSDNEQNVTVLKEPTAIENHDEPCAKKIIEPLQNNKEITKSTNEGRVINARNANLKNATTLIFNDIDMEYDSDGSEWEICLNMNDLKKYLNVPADVQIKEISDTTSSTKSIKSGIESEIDDSYGQGSDVEAIPKVNEPIEKTVEFYTKETAKIINDYNIEYNNNKCDSTIDLSFNDAEYSGDASISENLESDSDIGNNTMKLDKMQEKYNESQSRVQTVNLNQVFDTTKNQENEEQCYEIYDNEDSEKVTNLLVGEKFQESEISKDSLNMNKSNDLDIENNVKNFENPAKMQKDLSLLSEIGKCNLRRQFETLQLAPNSLNSNASSNDSIPYKNKSPFFNVFKSLYTPKK
ncbi:uncharacterized protein LOC107268430 isoform X2 [Cephus cinctus]|uniref:Uncharacterized protein LOC107268430 isoform X2 n=1 Tax=Cephus cinctus TaxID=211228 RepID=A0AAJ7RIH2_CEPCN|nr:uncharacterized protein LOC107268430 isoform X2 [Cephus cinctus]